MTIVRESFTSQANAATLSHTIAKPTGVVAGDVLVCSISFNGSPGTLTLPADWIQVVFEIGASNPRVGLYYKVCGSSEPANYTWTGTTSVASGMVIARFSGVDNTTPSDVAGVGSFSATTTNNFNCTGVTTVTDGAMVIGTCGVNSSSTGITENSTIMTEIAEIGGKKNELDSGILATAGATGVQNYTFSAARACAGIIWALRPAPSGTQFTQSVDGGITPTGAILRQGRKSLAGSISLSGALSRAVQVVRAGSLSLSGLLQKRASRSLTGTLTTSGLVVVSRITQKVLTGVITFSGSLIRRTDRPLGGTTSPSGAVIKQTSKSLVGSLTMSGVLAAIRIILKSLLGSITPSGVLTTSRQIGRSFVGSLIPTGILNRKTTKTFVGSLTTSGLTVVQKIVMKVLTGTLTIGGTLQKRIQKSLGGSLIPAGSLFKQVMISLSGILTFGHNLLATWFPQVFSTSTDPSRIYAIVEDRRWKIPAEERVRSLSGEGRVFIIRENRHYPIEWENRTYGVTHG